MTRFAGLLLAWLLIGAGAAAQEVDLQVRAPAEIGFGEPLEFTVTRSWTDDLVAGAWDDAALLPLGVEQVRVAKSRDRGLVVEERVFRCRALRPGRIEIPALVFRARLPGGGREFVAPAAPVRIIVQTTLAGHDAEEPDLPRGIMALPGPDRSILWLGGAAVLVVALALAGSWSLRRLRHPAVHAPPPPDRQALTDLAALRSAGRGGSSTAPFTELSRIARSYVAATFGIRAPWMTTRELEALLRTDARLLPLREHDLGALLVTCDERRFSGRLCERGDLEDTMARAERLVRATAATADAQDPPPAVGSGGP